jgi:parvulin-like peptidyl-prolyl isomerase
MYYRTHNLRLEKEVNPVCKSAQLFLMLTACLTLMTPLQTQAEPSKPVTTAAGKTWLKVNGTPIAQARFEGMLAASLASGTQDSPQLRQIIRSQLIVQELLRQEASKQHLQNDPQVIAMREQAVQQAMIQRYLELNLKPVPVTDAMVRARFEAIVATLGDIEYKPRIMALESEAAATDALARIKKQEISFAALAKQVSVLPSRQSGGELDWVSYPVPVVEGKTQGLPTTIAATLAALPEGGISKPIAAEGRFYLIQLDKKRLVKVPTYAEAAAGIRRGLETLELEKATATLMKHLMSTAKVEE